MARVSGRAPKMALAGVGRFDGQRGGAALRAGATPREPLAALRRKVDQACMRAGLPPEGRSFLPHVTVARLSRAAAADPAAEHWLGEHAGFASEAFTPAHLVLYESRLGGDGATYDAVARWPLSEETRL